MVLSLLAVVLAAGCAPVPHGHTSVAVSAGLSAIPVQFIGAWGSRPGGTGFDTDDGRMVVQAREANGWEWEGDLVSVTSNGPNDITVTFEGYGEGEPITVHERWILSADGSTLRTINLAQYSGTSLLYRARGWTGS